MENITELIKHPEYLNRDTLYDLRSLLALYPYYQTARLLMLQNLYLLHDPTFDQELRKAAVYITDRRILFEMVEAAHYRLRQTKKNNTGIPKDTTGKDTDGESRTITLIDSFLDHMPKEEPKKERRKPTPADAAVDYVSYLLESEAENETEEPVPEMKGQNLIDTFINTDKGRFVLNEDPDIAPSVDEKVDAPKEEVGEEYFTETLARIYIKQGRYSKALEIIQRLSLQFPKKNAYFADQIRFLEKLIINNNKK